MSYAVAGSRCRGATYETVVFKATFEFVMNGPARAVSPEPVVMYDAARSLDARSSLAVASEVAPFLPNAATLVSGFAHPPATAPRSPFAVRLALFASSGPLVDKYLHVVSETGAPVALAYEETVARQDNPSGSPRPRIIDPRQPEVPAGLGPISASWPSRAQHLRGAPAPQIVSGALELGTGVDGRYFNPAPLDQQTRALEGSETIVLEGVDPDQARWTTNLGGVVAQAMVSNAGAPPKPLCLFLDMLVIDAARRRFSLVWRALIPVSGRPNAPPPSVRVEAVLRVPNASVRPSEAPRAPTPRQPLSAALGSTLDIPAVPQSPALPFGAAQPRPTFQAGPAPLGDANEGAAFTKKRMLWQTMESTDGSKLGTAMPFVGGVTPQERAASREAQAAIPATPYERAYAPEAVAPASRSRPTLLDAMVVPPAPALLGGPVVPRAAPSPPHALEPQELPPPAQPLTPSPPALDDRGDPRRASVLSRLASGDALRDMDLAGADLSDLDLSGADLAGAILIGANLDGASLGGANLARADLSKARARKANLRGAKLESAVLVQFDGEAADLTGADLSRANAERAALTDAILDGVSAGEAIFERASLVKARFAGARLQKARFGRSSLDEANFEGADLTGADLGQCAGPGARFRGANLEGASLKQARFEGASLSGANLRGANLNRVDLNRAALAEADLTNVDARGARLQGADLRRAKLSGSDFRDGDLTGALVEGANLAEAKLKGAKPPNAT